MIAARESYLVMLTDACGHPFAIRNTSVLSIERWENWRSTRDKSWVYNEIVAIVVPEREDLEYQTMVDAKIEKRRKWAYIPVKGPLEDVVFALNQCVHMHRTQNVT
jgi:hypothetical protein